MMGKTHRPMSSAWWLGGVLAAGAVGVQVHPVAAAAGALIAPVFGAGRLSPDADVTWLRHLGHRRATHRPDTTAPTLTAITLAVWLIAGAFGVWGWPLGVHWLIWAPVTGWWSHLVGDSIFGRVPVGRRVGAVLLWLPLGPLVRQGGGGLVWVGIGLDTDGLVERGNWRLRRRTATGLHATRRVLPFAPATAGLHLLSWVLLVVIVVQSLRTGGQVPAVAS